MDEIYAVAVDTKPVMWVIHCEICNEEYGSPTDDELLIDMLESRHINYHKVIDGSEQELDNDVPDQL